MKTLNVKKKSKKEVQEKWETTLMYNLPNTIYIRCNAKGEINWEKAPSARYCHPREEHLLPLHVCLGLGDSQAQVIFDDYILGKRAVALLW